MCEVADERLEASGIKHEIEQLMQEHQQRLSLVV